MHFFISPPGEALTHLGTWNRSGGLEVQGEVNELWSGHCILTRHLGQPAELRAPGCGGNCKPWISDTVLDSFPNQLTQSMNHLCLLDTAFFVNSSYPPLLREERKADLIIHLNYSAGSQTKASVAVKGSSLLRQATE